MSRRGLSSHFPLYIFRMHPSKTPANVLFKGDTCANAFTEGTKTSAQKKDGGLQGNVPRYTEIGSEKNLCEEMDAIRSQPFKL